MGSIEVGKFADFTELQRRPRSSRTQRPGSDGSRAGHVDHRPARRPQLACRHPWFDPIAGVPAARGQQTSPMLGRAMRRPAINLRWRPLPDSGVYRPTRSRTVTIAFDRLAKVSGADPETINQRVDAGGATLRRSMTASVRGLAQRRRFRTSSRRSQFQNPVSVRHFL